MIRRAAQRSEPSAPPVVILGAARSGTKLLRAIVASADGFTPVPHDVNYVWSRLAPRSQHDAFPASVVTEPGAAFVRRQLAAFAGASQEDVVVEKTVSNTLRVAAVDRVIPDARYLHLIRDGWEVAESAWRCWQAPPEYRRLADKLRTFPWRSCGGYALERARDWSLRYLSGQRRLPSWGPRYPGIDEDLTRRPLAVVCATQWRRCVEQARADLARISQEQQLEVRYEDLTRDPKGVSQQIACFLGVRDPGPLTAAAMASVRPHQRRPWLALSKELREQVAEELSPLRGSLGYGQEAAA